MYILLYSVVKLILPPNFSYLRKYMLKEYIVEQIIWFWLINDADEIHLKRIV